MVASKTQQDDTIQNQDDTLQNEDKKKKLQEVNRLRRWASLVALWLGLFVVISLGLSARIFSQLASGGSESATDLRIILLCILAGTLGSSISALISVADRISHGWELSDGSKRPKSAKHKDMFVARMITWFLVRPLLGSAMGFLIYVGVVGGYLIAVKTSTPADFSSHGLTFLSFLGGLFAKTFLEKLKGAFDKLLGS